jgi:hypothetical protein
MKIFKDLYYSKKFEEVETILKIQEKKLNFIYKKRIKLLSKLEKLVKEYKKIGIGLEINIFLNGVETNKGE